MHFPRFPLAKDGCFSCCFKKCARLRRIHHAGRIAAALGWVAAVSPQALDGGLVYWGSQGFVENTDSRAREWTADFVMVLGVFSKDFVPHPDNREQWLANWTEVSQADFDPEEARFAGVADLSSHLPENSSPQVYLWARNGLDLTKGPEWLLLTRPDWKWPTSSSPQSPALTWTTGNSELIVLGAVDLNGSHLLSSRVAPVPVSLQTWLQSHFPASPTPVDPELDPDGDGVSNRLEYFLGSDPNNGSSTVTPRILVSQGETIVKLERNPFADSECIMEGSSDLRTWVRAAPEMLEDRPDLLEMKVPRDPSERARFFRFNFKPMER